MQLDHEKMDVYRIALNLVAIAHGIADKLPRGHSDLTKQLRRAATSIPLNIAEGAGEFSSGEKARFYRIARRSAHECAAILDVARRLEALSPGEHERARALLAKIIASLVGLIRAHG